MIDVIPWPEGDNITGEQIDAILGTGWHRVIDDMMLEAAAQMMTPDWPEGISDPNAELIPLGENSL